MALKLQLTGERPGYGRLLIENLAATGELQFSFQRSSDRHFLGTGQQWQATAHWHAVGGVEADGGGCSCLLGPDIIDGLLPSSNDAILVSVQGGGISDKGMMRTASSLLGSGAESEDREPEPVPTPSPAPPTTPEPAPEPAPTPEPISAPVPSSPAAGKRWLWMLLAALVLLAALFAAWYFGLLKLPGLPDGDIGTDTEPVTEPEAEISQDSGITEEDTTIVELAPALQGRPRAQAYLAGEPRPAPQAMFDQAADWEREDDCEAAMIVYQVAAQSDAGVAARYAQLYDPDTFKASACITNADPDTAADWYEAPAAAGDVNAQRQLGKILVGSHDSGVLRDQGESWLDRAAQAGDGEASALLETLGIGGD
jgi:hypothetical protein